MIAAALRKTAKVVLVWSCCGDPLLTRCRWPCRRPAVAVTGTSGCTVSAGLGFGLMAVDVPHNRVEVFCEPGIYRPRSDTKERKRLVTEHARRIGDPSSGGSSHQPVMTAYRQRGLACAALLRDKPVRPRELREVAADAGPILQRNVYGWFERAERGLYRLSSLGEAALMRWPGKTQQSLPNTAGAQD